LSCQTEVKQCWTISQQRAQLLQVSLILVTVIFKLVDAKGFHHEMIENNNEENENNASVDQLIGLKSIKDIIHMREDLELEEEANSPDMKAEQIDGEDENPTEFHANGKVHIFS